MSKFIILFMGPPRTATRSLWSVLPQHPEIARTTTKEPLSYFSSMNRILINPKSYLDEFKINSRTKVLLDTTPFPYHATLDLVKSVIEANDLEAKILYPVRKPCDRLYSSLKMLFVVKKRNFDRLKHITYPAFVKDKPIDFIPDKFLENIGWWLDTEILKDAVEVTDEILVFRFDKFDFDKIFEFVRLEPIRIESFIQINRLSEWNDLILPKMKVDAFFENNTQTRNDFDTIFLSQLQTIRNVYEIDLDDWISEIEENLSNT